MKVKSQTLEILNNLILGDQSFGYKKGYQIVEFYKKFGFDESYSKNFPSRSIYSMDRLKELNQGNKIEDVITEVFDPINFVSNPSHYNEASELINSYLKHDNLKLIKEDKKVYLIHIDEIGKINIEETDLIRIWENLNTFKIFLSHKSEAKILAKKLKDYLANYGINCFVAHEDIEPNEIWQNEIERALFSADMLIALLTKGFHNSNWTDQEIGIAIGRKIPIISLRLGIDPYGFIGKFQGLKISNQKDFINIVKILMKNKKKIDILISKLDNSTSFIESNELFELIKYIVHIENSQIERLIKVYKENVEVNGSFCFNGGNPKKYGYGLASELYRITGKKIKLD